eukprot:91289_1
MDSFHNNAILNFDDIRLLERILKRIIENPLNAKYRNINLNAIRKKLNNTFCIDILKSIGFQYVSSDDNDRLVFNDDATHQLESVYWQFVMMLTLQFNVYVPISNTTDSKNYGMSNKLYLYSNYNCNINNCSSLKNIGNALLLYRSYIDGSVDGSENIFDIVHCSVHEEYNNCNLLDDFNHLYQHHAPEIDVIHDILKKKIYDNQDCPSNCISNIRNRRNRVHSTKSEHTLKQLYQCEIDIASEQILDRIHCTLLHTHSFESERKQCDDMESDSKTFNDVDMARNRFTLIHDMQKYSFGTTYFYWTKSKICKLDENEGDYSMEWKITVPLAPLDWYITQKFKGLKQEVLHNELQQINMTQWNILWQDAADHIQTQHVRNMYCRRRRTAKYWDMKYGQQISNNHLISLMLYCNFDVLQYEYSKTFRPIDRNESAASIKERHRNFFHFSKLLRECVECFGMKKPNSDITVFHGTNKKFVFPAMHAFVAGPFSTTTDYNVAINFSQSKGMILELCIEKDNFSISSRDGDEAKNRLCCMDTWWISDYVNEQEILSIGGKNRCKFISIFDVEANINYQQYIDGLSTMMDTMSASITSLAIQRGKHTFKLDSDLNCAKDKKMAFRLFAHEFWRYFPDDKKAYEFKGCPEYVKKMLHMNCHNVKDITFIW